MPFLTSELAEDVNLLVQDLLQLGDVRVHVVVHFLSHLEEHLFVLQPANRLLGAGRRRGWAWVWAKQHLTVDTLWITIVYPIKSTSLIPREIVTVRAMMNYKFVCESLWIKATYIILTACDRKCQSDQSDHPNDLHDTYLAHFVIQYVSPDI